VSKVEYITGGEINLEQFVAGAEGCITDYWTVHQPAKDWVVLTQLLRISAAVI